MKTLIATALILTAGFAQAQSFDYEKQVGSAELYSTLNGGDSVSVSVGSSEFAYQVSIGSDDLFPTLRTSQSEPGVTGDRTVFEYQLNIGSGELDPSLS